MDQLGCCHVVPQGLFMRFTPPPLTRKLVAAFVAGAAAMVFLGIAAAAAIAQFGVFDVAASTGHMAFVRRLVHGTMIAAVKRSTSVVRVNVSNAAVMHGMCSYQVHCIACHGAPGTARAPWANGLNPTPPYLLDARVRWTPSELHWIVSNGVKMTAMPAWEASLPDKEIWELVAALETMPRLQPATYKSWVVQNCREPERSDFYGSASRNSAAVLGF